jgi:hypothetical protein
MESITSIPNRRNNTNNSTSDKFILSDSRDLSVGVVHYNMEAFGEN